uniref:CHAD domain-containing protein n=1 Tax=Phenylobacterium glaciei TaxID=2803784 RepID=A0A974S9G4_9CAUL|nr:CHAD domain-containing protein [Phenylobacterium glaciei]
MVHSSGLGAHLESGDEEHVAHGRRRDRVEVPVRATGCRRPAGRRPGGRCGNQTPDRGLFRHAGRAPEGGPHLAAPAESGGKRVQTLKRGDGFAREEHEAKVAGDTLDLAMPAVKAALKPAQRKALAPVFTVRVTRQQRTFSYGGAEIELALDQGEITASDQRRDLCELELELKSGDPAALFALARQLSVTAPLYLSFDGKASQGQALMAGTRHEPRRHDKAPLRRGGTTGEAFQTIARNALVQIAANGVVLRETDSQDALHQLRVAVRRLRSAMSTFKTVAADDRVRHLRAELKWLSGACDEARDLDVFAQDNLEIVGAKAPWPRRSPPPAPRPTPRPAPRWPPSGSATWCWRPPPGWRPASGAGLSAVTSQPAISPPRPWTGAGRRCANWATTSRRWTTRRVTRCGSPPRSFATPPKPSPRCSPLSPAGGSSRP